MEEYKAEYYQQHNCYYYKSHKDGKLFEFKEEAELYDELSDFDFLKYTVIQSDELSRILALDTYPEYVYVVNLKTKKDKEKLFDFLNKKNYINNVDYLDLNKKYLLYFQQADLLRKSHAYTYSFNMLKKQIEDINDEIDRLNEMIIS